MVDVLTRTAPPQYVRDSRRAHEAGDGRPFARASARLPLPAAPQGPARQTRSGLPGEPQSDPCAWLLLAHARLPLRPCRAGDQRRILAEQADVECRTRCA